ncbi:MAG TPA: PIN domain-containing protein [Thermoanaerobaculia bacterium]|nr:PIN domain-containing protein [Thermoanaerobaculia bacterium]
MILVDTGPLVALFDRRDPDYQRCAAILEEIREPLRTTIPVLTEAFHLLDPASPGADALREFVTRGGLPLWFFDDPTLRRAFELMERYADHPMDLADASLVVAAESLRVVKVFTIARDDFNAYRIRRGHRYVPFQIIR